MGEQIDRVRVFGERSEAVERIAPGFFDRSFESEHLARYKWSSRWVDGRVVVDVACGTGYGAAILRGAGARGVVSLDVSRDALRFGFKRYSMVAVCCDAQSLPLGTGTSEVVVSLETIEHLANPIAFIKEIRRILRAGGELLLSTPNSSRSSRRNPYHINEMTLEELRNVLVEGGFRERGIWGQHWQAGSRVWPRIKGVRRILVEIERRNAVVNWIRLGLKPAYWCIRAVRA